MSVVADVIGGAALILSGYTAKRKISRDKRRDAKAETKAEVADEVAKAEELAELRAAIGIMGNDMKWVKEQLGEKPNGGGSMEQMLRFVNFATTEFADIKAWNMRHMELHLEDKKG